jgi:organic radical activating enzyme
MNWARIEVSWERREQWMLETDIVCVKYNLSDNVLRKDLMAEDGEIEIITDHRFLAKKTNMSTLCGSSRGRLAVTMLPATLKSRSDAELVPQTHKYLRASLANDGYAPVCILHHCRGSASS